MSDILLRKAAIRLACMHPEDRRWILAQLASSERKQLVALIREASELGLTADPAVAQAVLSERNGLLSDESTGLDIATGPGHPFWTAMLLEREGEERRDEALLSIDDSAVHRWSKVLRLESLPVAQVEELYLRAGTSPAKGG